MELLDKTFELFGGDLFSDEQIRINKDTFGIKDGLDFIKDPKVLEFIGAATLGVGTSLVLTRTAVGVSAKVGLNKIPLAVRSVASRFAANGKSVASTKGLLGKLGMSNITASHALAILGTYPFAGFIKEEALQTAGMGFESAYWNGDKEGMEDAIAIQDEMLDPSMWSRVVAKVPFANVLGSLNDYWKAASKKNEIHKKVLQSLKGG